MSKNHNDIYIRPAQWKDEYREWEIVFQWTSNQATVIALSMSDMCKLLHKLEIWSDEYE